MKTQGFNGYHPIVNFTYFALVIVFSMFFMHPMCLIISLFSALCHLFILKGRTASKSLVFAVVAAFMLAIINPLFSHEGITIITYFPNGNPLTKESVIYGLGAGIMLSSVILHFSCYNEVLTSDKFIYLFGKIIPTLSLIISMTLNFIPEFSRRIKSVAVAQKCIGKSKDSRNILKRAKNGLNILSVTLTCSLEKAIDTSDSMKARGYGLSKRTSYSNFRFDTRDAFTLGILILLGTVIIAGTLLNQLDFTYYPSVKGHKLNLFSVLVFASYLLLGTLPVIINVKEALKWKFLKSKI